MGRLSLWVLLGLTMFALSLHDVQVSADVGPTESECRPYIEKAINELKIGETTDSGEPDASDAGDDSKEQELSAEDTGGEDVASGEKEDETESAGKDDDDDDDDDDNDDDDDGDNTTTEDSVVIETVEESEEEPKEEGSEDQSKEEQPETLDDDNGDDKDDDEKSQEEVEDDNDKKSEEAEDENKSTEEDDEQVAVDEGKSEEDEEEKTTSKEGEDHDDDDVDDDEDDDVIKSAESKDQEEDDSKEQGTEEDTQNEDSGEVDDDLEHDKDDDDDKPKADSVEEPKSEEEGDDKDDDEDSKEIKDGNNEDDDNDDNNDDDDDETEEKKDNKEDDDGTEEEKDEEDAKTRGKRSIEDDDDDDDEISESKEKSAEIETSTEDDDKNEQPADGEGNEDSKEDDKKGDEKDVDEDSTEQNEADNDKDEEDDGDDDDDDDDDDEESRPEDDLLLEVEIPENLRDRKHIDELLHLVDEYEAKENAIDRAAEIILRDLKRIYENAIKPLEALYKYRDLSNRHFGDPEIFSKPLILFMGPWSGGKSTIINYLTENEYTPNSLTSGAEPSPAYFNIVMYGNETEILDGTQLAADWTFSGLQKFGQGLEDRLRGLKLPNKLLEKVNIVEIPGILEVRKQVSRLFPFNDACQWFIDRADIIFLVYDPAKLDVGPETEAILDQLKGREYQTRIVLNKADTVKPEELLRVQSALIWNISPLMSSAQPPAMYTTSLWSHPYESSAPVRLLQAQERAFLRDIRGAIDKRIENKIASARRFAVRVRNHAKMVDCYLTTYYNHKTLFGNKKRISDEIIENPQNYHIYEGLSTLTNISRYDLPDPEVYRDFFRLNPLYEFKKLSETCTYFRGCPINKLDVAIAYDLPELVGKYKKMAEASLASLESDDKSKS